MPRVKRGVQHVKHRKALRKRTKGFRANRKVSLRLGKTAAIKAGVHSYVGRKLKKRNYRALWQIRISAATKELGMSYSKFIGALAKHNIALDRKVLALLAAEHPDVFKAIVEEVKK